MFESHRSHRAMIMTYGLPLVCDFETLMYELSILTADYMLPSNSKTPLSAKYKLQWDRDQSCRRRSIMMRSTHYTDGNERVPSRSRSLLLTSGSSFLVVADFFLNQTVVFFTGSRSVLNCENTDPLLEESRLSNLQVNLTLVWRSWFQSKDKQTLGRRCFKTSKRSRSVTATAWLHPGGSLQNRVRQILIIFNKKKDFRVQETFPPFGDTTLNNKR